MQIKKPYPTIRLADTLWLLSNLYLSCYNKNKDWYRITFVELISMLKNNSVKAMKLLDMGLNVLDIILSNIH